MNYFYGLPQSSKFLNICNPVMYKTIYFGRDNYELIGRFYKDLGSKKEK